MNEEYRAWGVLKIVLSYRGFGIKAKKCLYEGVIVPTALYGAKACGMRSVEKRNVNDHEMKSLRSLVGVLRMDRVSNENVYRRAGIERELASREDQRVLSIEMDHTARCDWMAEVSRDRVRGRPRLGWMDGVKVALGYRLMAVEAAHQCEND